jgi:hypothetical protein
MKQIFYVDWAMCGGEQVPEDFDLEDFCEVLQGKLAGVEVVPVLDADERAVNRDPSLVPDTVFTEALGEYCQR